MYLYVYVPCSCLVSGRPEEKEGESPMELELLPPTRSSHTSPSYLRHHVLKRFHDLGALGLLIIWEAASDEDHSSEYDTQVQLKTGEESVISTSFPPSSSSGTAKATTSSGWRKSEGLKRIRDGAGTLGFLVIETWAIAVSGQKNGRECVASSPIKVGGGQWTKESERWRGRRSQRKRKGLQMLWLCLAGMMLLRELNQTLPR